MAIQTRGKRKAQIDGPIRFGPSNLVFVCVCVQHCDASLSICVCFCVFLCISVCFCCVSVYVLVFACSSCDAVRLGTVIAGWNLGVALCDVYW